MSLRVHKDIVFEGCVCGGGRVRGGTLWPTAYIYIYIL